MDLSGKVALITGGGIRVGAVISLALAKNGADIVLSYWGTEEETQKTQRQIEAMGRQCMIYEANMRDINALQEMIRAVERRFGRLDILVHNASNFNDYPYAEITEEIWDSSQEIICKGAFFLSQAAVPLMKKHHFGRMIAMIGDSYYCTWPTFIAHSVAKVALVKVMEGLAIALSPEIQCTAICPADILSSNGGRHIQSSRGEQLKGENSDYIEISGQTLKRGNPDDVAELVVYLSGCGSYMNGAVIPLDGGKHLL